jgi:hypoxanthine phosphoribosyltransferase
MLKRSYDYRKMFLGKRSGKLILPLLSSKKRLRKEAWPIEATFKAIEEYYQRLKPALEGKISENTILFATPSSDGKNPIAQMICERISSDFNCKIAINNDRFKRTENFQAKDNLKLDTRNKKIIDFQIENNDLDYLKGVIGEKDVFCVDDCISTGESIVRFSRRLEQNGIKVKGYVGLTNNELTQPDYRDYKAVMDRLSGKGVFTGKGTRKEKMPDFFKNKTKEEKEEFTKQLFVSTAGYSKHIIWRNIKNMFRDVQGAKDFMDAIPKRYELEKQMFPEHTKQLENYYNENYIDKGNDKNKGMSL